MVVVGALWTWILELQDLDKAEQFLRQNIYSKNNIQFISNFVGAMGFDLIQGISVIVMQSAMCNIPLTRLRAKYFYNAHAKCDMIILQTMIYGLWSCVMNWLDRKSSKDAFCDCR